MCVIDSRSRLSCCGSCPLDPPSETTSSTSLPVQPITTIKACTSTSSCAKLSVSHPLLPENPRLRKLHLRRFLWALFHYLFHSRWPSPASLSFPESRSAKMVDSEANSPTWKFTQYVNDGRLLTCLTDRIIDVSVIRVTWRTSQKVR